VLAALMWKAGFTETGDFTVAVIAPYARMLTQMQTKMRCGKKRFGMIVSMYLPLQILRYAIYGEG